MNSKKRVLILGGEGFIGRNLSDVLSDDFNCFSVGLRKSFFSGNKASFIQADPYREKISGHFDIIIHLIDNPVPLEKVEENEQELLKNIDSVSPEHLIVFSSAAIYMSPDSEYAKRKSLLEETYKKHCQNNQIGLSLLRLFNIYGPYQLPKRRGSLIANLLYGYFTKKPVLIDDLQAKRDFIYAPDMAKCVGIVIKKKLFGTDDLAANKMTTYDEIVSKIDKILSDKIIIADGHTKETVKCPDASSQIINLIQPTDTDQALRETVSFYRENWRLIGENQDAK